MPYIGNEVGNRFVASKSASVYSGDGSTTAFTLEHAVGSDEDILVSVDGVIQEPSVAYAVSSGTTLTFTAAPSSNSGNNIFVYYLFRTVATVDHPSTSSLQATDGTFSAGVTATTGAFSGAVSAASLDADGGVTVDNITIDGQEIDVSSGDLTLDVAGDITLDADGGDIRLSDAGTQFGKFTNSSSDFIISSSVNDKDMKFAGADGGADITALTLDMSAAGAAAFNSYLTATAVYGKDDGNTGIQFDGSDVITLHTGGAEHMKIDANGIVTKPNQPAFLAQPASTINNLNSGANNSIVFGTERFDQNADYDASSGVFTAPVTGKYMFNVTFYLNNIDSAAGYYEPRLDTSNRSYYVNFDPDFGQDNSYFTISFHQLVDMDANDTADINIHQNGGSSQTDISAASTFSMYLVC